MFMNAVQEKRSALKGLKFYYQDIRLNRQKAGKENLVLPCVGIVEAIIVFHYAMVLLKVLIKKIKQIQYLPEKGISSFIMHVRC